MTTPAINPFLEDDSDLEGERLQLRWLPVDKIPSVLWEQNPKLHDIGELWQSIVKFGFRDPAAFDINLTNKQGTKGALIFGNGRSEALWWGYQEFKAGRWEGEAPRGIATDKAGVWFMPVKAGIDAGSEAAAADFGIFHNSSTMLGGDFSDGDIWNLYDKEALLKVGKLIQSDKEFSPLSMTGEEVDSLLTFLGGDGDESAAGEGLDNLDTMLHQKLSDRFLIPPFSVLDARQGYWQERKKLWLSLGIQSELGRGADIVPNGTHRSESSDGAYFRSSKPHAITGGSLRPATSLGADGKTQRGDGTGKPIKIKGKDAAAIGGSPLPLDRMKNGKGKSRTFAQDLMKGEHVVGGLTWVEGSPRKDETSRKILAAGRKSTAARIQLGDNTNDSSNPTNIHNIPSYYWKKERGMSDEEILEAYIANGGGTSVSGTSIFDPVLCELAYTWFTPKGAHILDPFAGGSVRGIIASKLGRQYTGVDLRAEQIEENIRQGEILLDELLPNWITGDSQDVQSLASGEYDFLFTCPPYADLEIYSDDERDISNMDYPQFLEVYRHIISESCAMLRDNRFACIVVGDIRDKKGNYRNFVSDTIQAFMDSGLSLYNEAILVTSVGSLPIRAGKQFAASRKLGKTHQNVLCFLKGDSRTAAEYCGIVDVYIPEVEETPIEDNEDDSQYGERLNVP